MDSTPINIKLTDILHYNDDEYAHAIDTIKEITEDLFKLKHTAENIVQECSDKEKKRFATMSNHVIENLLDLINKPEGIPGIEIFEDFVYNSKNLYDEVRKQFKNKNKEILYTNYFVNTFSTFSINVHCFGILLMKKNSSKNSKAFSYFLVKLLNCSVSIFNTFTDDDSKCISFDDIYNKIKNASQVT